MAMRWYIVHVYSGFEKKVEQSIREQAQIKGLAERFEQVLVPSEQVVEMRRGQKVLSDRKFFPGYVLVKMDMNDESWHLVKNTPKVTGFLGGGGRPVSTISRVRFAVSRSNPVWGAESSGLPRASARVSTTSMSHPSCSSVSLNRASPPSP